MSLPPVSDRGGPAAGMPEPTPDADAQDYWEDFYRDHTRGEEGRVNGVLAEEVADLPPGRALDLGSGEGADAIWLAERGWTVTAVDVSATALHRASAHAARLGLTDRIAVEQHDLTRTFPDGRFDLVSAQFLHSPVERRGERGSILRRAADAVSPGGVLLIGSHQGWPSWVTEPPFDVDLPTVQETLDLLALDAEWTAERLDVLTRQLPGPDGAPGSRQDNVVRLRRSGSRAAR